MKQDKKIQYTKILRHVLRQIFSDHPTELYQQVLQHYQEFGDWKEASTERENEKKIKKKQRRREKP